ncbi:MAG: flagellar biosynthetic protein FliR [Desulfobacterota bacterium]|nr:flagellar biosynthetic protein FliR [Thermodesulfobacteriota bacterium]
MMTMSWSLEQIETYLLVFIRTSAILFAVPIFGSRDLPIIAKMGLALTLAWCVYPGINIPPELRSGNLGVLVPAMIAEIGIGLAIGFAARLFFEAVQIGGQLIGFQMGFGIVNVLDPLSGENFSVVAQLQNLLAVMLFLWLNLHHVFFMAIAGSFERIPLLHCSLPGPLIENIASMSTAMFSVAIKLAAPVIAVLLLCDCAMGILNRAAPQMHVFILSFPLKIAAGLFVIGITMPMFCFILNKAFGNLGQYIARIIVLGKAV